jgi:Mg-chelatase subunit ChlD
MVLTASIGTDPTKAIQTIAKVGTFTMKVNAQFTGTQTISFGTQTAAYAFTTASTTPENVLASTSPAYISNATTTAPSPTISTTLSATHVPPTATAAPTTRPSTSTSPTPTAPIVGGACSSVATDTILVIDRSGSMKEEIAQAKAAAKQYVDIAANNSQNRIGVVTFSDTAAVAIGLTNNFASVKSAIDAISVNGGTCTQCGIDKANAEIQANGRSGIKKANILLTDGLANKVSGNSSTVSPSVAESAAIQSAKTGKTTSGTAIFSIGLGNEVNAKFLETIASETGGKYYFSPTADQLSAVYQDIASTVGKGSITGTVFNDINANGTLDTGEQQLSGWTLSLKTSAGAPVATQTSNSSGNYAFTNLCDGITYIVTVSAQSGWTQTVPSNNGTYSITITNGSSVANKDFGFRLAPSITPTPIPPSLTFSAEPIEVQYNGATNFNWIATNATSCTAGGGWSGTKNISGTEDVTGLTSTKTYTLTCSGAGGSITKSLVITVASAPSATPTLIPSETILNITAFLHSIGNSGDNRNPDAFDFSNKTPKHPQRSVVVEVFDANNQPILQKQTTVLYASSSGNFKGTVGLGTNFVTGNYLVTIKTDRYLRALFPGIQTLTKGQTNTLPATTLIAGDTNGDNKLDILDYNNLLGCYTSEDQPTAKNCDDVKQLMTDLNDDGSVDRYDYNLFLRELSVQAGF